MSEIPPTIDLQRIRAYDGSQRGGFEQLSVELFARTNRLSRRLVRIDGSGGDGGVECYAVVEGRGKVGMQAKLFDKGAGIPWKQIDRSVKAALVQHPDLKEYHVYVSVDRTKGSFRKSIATGNPRGHRGIRRTPKRTEGGLEKWKKFVESWRRLPNGADVEFIWQGRHEIEVALKSAENRDLLFYWFGARQFDDDFIDRVLQTSLQTLSDRYQPDRHVDGEVVRELDRFMWSPSFASEMESAYVEIAETSLGFRRELANITECLESSVYSLEPIQAAVDGLLRVEFPAYDVRTVAQATAPAETLLNELAELREYLVNSKADRKDKRYDNAIDSVERFATKVESWIERLRRDEEVDLRCALVRGEAGSGKSHLLAHCAEEGRKRKQPIVLLLGEQFLDSRPPTTQVCELVGWTGGIESFLSALNVAGSLAELPAVICIDALNESSERRLWKSHLHSLAAHIGKFPHIRLVVSCRSDFLGTTLPNDFRSYGPASWAVIEHRGLGDVLAQAVARYFASYNVRSTYFPPLLDEFRNPLFLDTFCRAFENRTLPDGPIMLSSVMERRIDRLCEKLEHDIDCSKYHVRAAIDALAVEISNNEGRPVDERVARAAIDPHSPSPDSSRALYTHLLSNKVIVTRMHRSWDDDPSVTVRFAFERFSDHFIARGLLKTVSDATAFRTLLGDAGRLAWIRDWGKYRANRGVARALAILAPELFGVELVQTLPADIEHRGDLLADLLDSLPWRNASSMTESSEPLLIEAASYVPLTSLIETLLRVSTVPGHPFNALFLHGRLVSKSLPERDATWTIPVAELAADSATVPSTLVEWALQVPLNLVSDQQASLVATVLLWFCSSNRVAFRTRAGHAAIRILRGRAEVTRQLVERFDAVNDPYVVERLYAVACGVAMREPQGDGLRQLAATVHRLVFATSEVRPHVLLRDYAQVLLETAQHRGSLDPAISPECFRPPFKSTFPTIIDEAQSQQIERETGWRAIAASVRPESSGMYGDFGRYIMGSSVHYFLSKTKQEPMPDEPIRHRFGDKLAQRWVLQRTKSLGWTADLFYEYDDGRHDGRMTDDRYKVERIGKKYQWIALHELLGFISDHYQMDPDWGDEKTDYRGAWQISQRDFDPSAEPEPRASEDDDEEAYLPGAPKLADARWRYVTPYPDPFDDRKLLANRSAWVRARPADILPLLTAARDDDTHQWVVLNGYWSWKEPRLLRLRHGWDGRCEMWIHARSWLVLQADAKGFVKRISGLNFWGHGLTGVPLGDGWIGEYPHGAAFAEAPGWCEEPDRLTNEDRALHVRTTCDWDRRGGAIIPSPQLCQLLGARWSGTGASFIDSKETEIATTAPLPNAGETSPGLVDLDRLRSALLSAGLQIVWGVVGERRCWNGEKMVGNVETQFSGVYTLSRKGIAGKLTVVKTVDLPLRP